MDRVKSYLEEICSVIKCKEVHDEIKEEMKGHIEELSTEYIDNGYEKEEACKLAIRDMGDSVEIGFKLNKIYEKKIEYKTLIIAILLSLFGFSFTFILNNKLSEYTFSPLNQVMFFIVGIVAFIALYYFDYRKLEKYSYHVFGISIFFSFIQGGFGRVINGMPRFIFVNFDMFILIGFLISISGIIKGFNFKEKKQILIAIGIFIIGNFSLFYTISIINNFIFTAIFIILLFQNSHNKFIPSAFSIVSLGSILFPIINHGYFRMRMTIFLNYKSDPYGMGYQNMEISKILSSSNFIGKLDTSKIESLPASDTSLIFTFIISVMGWMVALAIIITVLVFLVILFKNTKKINNRYGKNIMISITTIFGIQFVVGILMSINLFPIILSITLPFIGYGGSSMLSSMIMLGLISSIYSRKNLKNSFDNVISS